MARFEPSPHKAEAMDALANGVTPEEVAARLGITERTAYRYKAQLEAELNPEPPESPQDEVQPDQPEQVVERPVDEPDIAPKPVTPPSKNKKADTKAQAARTTLNLAEATEIKFTPRTYSATYTPIMMQAQDAAVKYFGWRKGMPFENFIDTVLFLAFKQWGITLGGYVVDETILGGDGDGQEAEPEELTPIAN